MTTTGRSIPRQRLRHIPRYLRFAHEYCYFLHDQCVHLLVQYESAEAHLVSVPFKDEAETAKFQSIANETNAIDALRSMGYEADARRVTLNTITMAMVSDCLHHVYEALRCLEKRKSVVALNLLRKPLLDSLIFLSWMLGDEDAFYSAFSSGNPDLMSDQAMGNRRKQVIVQALAVTEIASMLDPEFVLESLYDSRNPLGLYGLFQHAVHLVTVKRAELRTTPENFNFIFKSHTNDDVYDGIYELLPSVLLYMAHVILELYDRVKPMDSGAKRAFVIRSILGHQLTGEQQHAGIAITVLTNALSPHIVCSACAKPLTVTLHNAMRIVIAESFRCTHCRKVCEFPFSWIF